MIQQFKNARRRMTETVLAKVGASERTVDEQYDIHVEKFKVMLEDMNECGAALHSFLSRQKDMMADGEELARSLTRIYESNADIADWPDCECEMKFLPVAQDYGYKMDLLQNTIRSSASTVCCERALDPLRGAVTQLGPDMEELCKEREIKLTDYDSFRRRLKEKEVKKETLENNNKGTAAHAAELEKAQIEIEKFQRKVQTGLEEYVHLNQKAKVDIAAARNQHDELMDNLLLTTIVCQAEMFNQAACQLETILESLPQDRVEAVRAQVHEFISQGGIRAQPPPEKSKLMKGLDIVTGKSVPADFQKTSQGPTSVSSVSSPAAAIEAEKDPFGENPFGENSDTPAPPPPSSAPPPPPDVATTPTAAAAATTTATTTTAKTMPYFVVALFDHDAEEEDELNFKAGEKVEVIEKPDDGWWRGRCNGAEGLFPSNYVQ